MEITRLYTDANGGSHFEEYPINMTQQQSMGYFAELKNKVTGVYFQNILPHHEWDFMTPADKIYVVITAGRIELEVSDGEKRTFQAGDIIFFDDHSGKGHKASTFQTTCSTMILYVE